MKLLSEIRSNLLQRLHGGGWVRHLASALFVLGTAAGCGGAAEAPATEAKIRKSTPIPVCATPLPPAKAAKPGEKTIRALDPEQWLPVVFPGYAPDKGIAASELDCTGQYAFANETLRGGTTIRGWDRKVEPEEIDMRAGPDGLRVIWLRSLKFENGDEGGPIALVRAVDDQAEVYAVGSFRGSPKTKLQPVRLGSDSIVAAETKVCPDPDDCRKQSHFFLMRRGRLIQSAVVDLERVAVLPSVTERGLYARYTLRTDVNYQPDGIQLVEQIRVRILHDDSGTRDSDRDLRKVEFSRLLRVDRDALFSSNDPLWERVVGQD